MASSRLAGLLIALSVAGCGASAPSKPVARRICDGAFNAAIAGRRGSSAVYYLNNRPADVDCVMRVGRMEVEVVSQATPQAYTEFNTEDSHQSQVYGPGVNRPDRQPMPAAVPGASVAVWVPGQRELIATNGSPSRQGGAYVTVTVSHASVAAARALAVAVARAVFAAHPASS